jgi:hypothetical protein
MRDEGSYIDGYAPAVQGLSPRMLCAAVYKHLGEKMRFMWDSKLRLNTVRRSRYLQADVSAFCVPKWIHTSGGCEAGLLAVWLLARA